MTDPELNTMLNDAGRIKMDGWSWALAGVIAASAVLLLGALGLLALLLL